MTGNQMRDFAQRLRNAAPRPLTEEQILAWADAHHQRIGEWPDQDSGTIYDAPEEKWASCNAALREGLRGLPGGSSLAKLLAERRGVPNHMNLLPLEIDQILAWADVHRQHTGEWPNRNSGAVQTAAGEIWSTIDTALRVGYRRLPRGSSLARLLAEYRSVPNKQDLPVLSIDQILAWADVHYWRTGKWPTQQSGPVEGEVKLSWRAIHLALNRGGRGLPGGSSMAKLLAEHRGSRNRLEPPPLRVNQILAWADAHFTRTGKWPTYLSGEVQGSSGETWSAVHHALRDGRRGLPGGSSLAQLFAQERGVPNSAASPPLTIEQILAWADACHERTGRWPNRNSGPIFGTANETWGRIDKALKRGYRGLSGASSLAILLLKERQVPHQSFPVLLTENQILAWADSHYNQTGEWPHCNSGSVIDAPNETWSGLNAALERGNRGLSGGCSLARLLAEQRGLRNKHSRQQLTVELILAWADAHFERTG